MSRLPKQPSFTVDSHIDDFNPLQLPEFDTPSQTTSSYDQKDTEMSFQPLVDQTVIDRYFKGATPAEDDEDWLRLPEVPTADEILGNPNDTVPENIIDNDWPSKHAYLKAQYEFLREESTFALRKAVDLVKRNPFEDETNFKNDSPGIGIYGSAFVTGIVLCRRGLAVRMCFSTFRTGVKIDWPSSKRLKSGSLIAISPAQDRFTTETVIIGIVAARPLFLVDKPLPEIDIFFPRPEDTILDPAVEYVIVEETSSFFEAQRHNMLAIQRMTKESTPLQQYTIKPRKVDLGDLIDLGEQTKSMCLVDADEPRRRPDKRAVGIPDYVQQDPIMDLVSATGNEIDQDFNLFQDYLVSESELLDQSQMEALQQILTKEVALVQGPPGTGKTHVSVKALEAMLCKLGEQRKRATPDKPVPPIIVACQTNHALDQLLRHVAKYEDSFVRLGGRSADTGVVHRHKLYELQQELPPSAPPKDLRDAKKAMRIMENSFKKALSIFDGSEEKQGPMDEDCFRNHLSEKQIDSIRNSKWQTSGDSELSSTSAIIKWLGQDAPFSDSTQKWTKDQEFGFDAFDAEPEEVDEATVEKGIQDDKIERLQGPFIPLVDHSILTVPSRLSAQDVQKVLKKLPDLNKIPIPVRRMIYVHLVEDVKREVLQKVKVLAAAWDKEVKRCRTGKFTKDLEILQDAKIIGLTVTGFAKYRPMIYALKSRVVLIEEAGECLEANMCSVFLPSLQHLILVGDHQQLRPRAQKIEHNRLHYDISLFERLADNNIEYRMLAVQRRMPPEVRKLLYPIYGNAITDHQDVLHRPQIPGLENNRTYFIHHEELETQDKIRSYLNEQEAKKIVGFVKGLIRQGTSPEKITILTFYNGQRRLLIRKLKDIDGKERNIDVKTVDSYQGEENDIIVLSLVRSNFSGSVGFLSVANRVCVALSRAMMGLYVFGNVGLLEQAGGEVWKGVIEIFRGKGVEDVDGVESGGGGGGGGGGGSGGNRVVKAEWAEQRGLLS